MMDNQLIETVKKDDIEAVRGLIKSGADIDQKDDYGWSALNHAAGKGNPAIVGLLIESGADALNVGRDLRTPYLIALAAGHAEVAKMLIEAEEKAGKSTVKQLSREYCAAFPLEQLRGFPGWNSTLKDGLPSPHTAAADADRAEDQIVFLHHDYTVTKSIWRNEQVIYDQVTPAWIDFCSDVLGFRTPSDIDLISGSSNDLRT
jgi:ankyrin repeat protein